jgi:hypothetical protein
METSKLTYQPTDKGLQDIAILSNALKTCFCHTGRPPKLSLEQVYEFIRIKKDYDVGDWKKTFKVCQEIHPDWDLPVYHNCLSSLHRLFGYMFWFVQMSLYFHRKNFFESKSNLKVVFMDSTCVPVCHILRSSRHKTMKNYAQYSKSTMGWYYGLKLHCVMDYENNPLYFTLTRAKIDDRVVSKQVMQDKELFYGTGTLFVEDKGYQSKEHEQIAKDTGNFLLTGKRKSKNNTTLASWFDIHLLHNRARIETVFSKLKVNYNLTSTKARSEFGYFFNIIFSLFALITENY